MTTIQVSRNVAIELSKLPAPVLLNAYHAKYGSVPETKADAVSALGGAITNGHYTVADVIAWGHNKIRDNKTNTTPEPNANTAATAAAAARAEALALENKGKVEGLEQQATTLADNLTKVTSEMGRAAERIESIAASIIKVDGAAIADQIRVTVESAFKPIKEAAEANGTVAQVLEVSGQASIIGRDTCANVFGVDVRDAHGNPVEVDLWNSPDAPPVDDSFIWSADILKALALGQGGLNLWFGGDKGTGKTQTAMQFAARTGRPFTRYNFRKFTTSEDFLGAVGLVNGASVFKPGPVLQAYINAGAVILLDEPSATDPGELIQLNGLLEEGVPRVNIGGTTWVKGQNVMVIAADNTLGSGDSSGRYAGTRMMNSALMDRFALVVPFTFLPPDQEEAALVNITKCKPQMAEAVVSLLTVCRTKTQSGELVEAPSIRSAINFIRSVPVMGVRGAWNASIAARQPAESAVTLEAIYQSFVDEAHILGLAR